MTEENDFDGSSFMAGVMVVLIAVIVSALTGCIVGQREVQHEQKDYLIEHPEAKLRDYYLEELKKHD